MFAWHSVCAEAKQRTEKGDGMNEHVITWLLYLIDQAEDGTMERAELFQMVDRECRLTWILAKLQTNAATNL